MTIRSGLATTTRAREARLQRAKQVLTAVCQLAGSISFIDDIDHDFKAANLETAVATRSTVPIFDCLVDILSFQGISDRVARDYAAKHGHATWQYLDKSLNSLDGCPKLRSYWQYADCDTTRPVKHVESPTTLMSVSCPNSAYAMVA